MGAGWAVGVELAMIERVGAFDKRHCIGPFGRERVPSDHVPIGFGSKGARSGRPGVPARDSISDTDDLSGSFPSEYRSGAWPTVAAAIRSWSEGTARTAPIRSLTRQRICDKLFSSMHEIAYFVGSIVRMSARGELAHDYLVESS